MDIDVKRLRELLAAANPALPWTCRMDGRNTEVVDADNATICDDVTYYPEAVDRDDQRLIAEAITALPELLRVYEAWQGELTANEQI